MMITRKALPRRTFLRGMGTAVALPFDQPQRLLGAAGDGQLDLGFEEFRHAD